MALPAASPGSMDQPPYMDPRTGENVLGLLPGTVRLREYTPLWAQLYRVEAARIRSALRELALDVQHVGSTAVPGLKAKPILDIAVAIPAHAIVPKCATSLAALGYEYAYWVELENDFTFEKGVARTHHVHLVELDSRQWSDYLRFRDALRQNAQLLGEYERVKLELGARFCRDRVSYTREKAEFICRVLSMT
ncbi:MAG: GrpB family protein [Burkholderiales bacterium]